MLTLRLINHADGTHRNANYTYMVFVNGREIARGEVKGHNRDNGWEDLVRMIADNHERDDEEIEFHGEGVA